MPLKKKKSLLFPLWKVCILTISLFGDYFFTQRLSSIFVLFCVGGGCFISECVSVQVCNLEHYWTLLTRQTLMGFQGEDCNAGWNNSWQHLLVVNLVWLISNTFIVTTCGEVLDTKHHAEKSTIKPAWQTWWPKQCMNVFCLRIFSHIGRVVRFKLEQFHNAQINSN